MTNPSWRRVEEVFQDAVDKEPHERADYLERACAGDPMLRAEVDSLLEAAAAPAPWLDGCAAPAALELLADDADLLPGTILGSYRLLELLGVGGMGTVYLAERSDGEFRQRVALKVIKRGMDTDALLARFRRERQILAQLEHPGIARLIDGGAAPDGRPYLVMEHVEGVTIDTYVSRQRLTIDDRLTLFTGICDVVRYAHRNLVIHRDLKPSNILVTGDGSIKLLDFGTARLIEETGDVRTVGPRVLTPSYASPEQIQGGAITTSSDVFALGVLLYELLSGVHPFRLDGRSTDQICAAVLDAEPIRPSLVAPPDERALVRGDLDAIVERAMRKEPSARYESVAALADDVASHRCSLPVRARRGTLRYRTSRWVRRHRTTVVFAAIAFAVVVAFVAALLAEQRETGREQLRAQAITEYLKGLFSGFDPFQSGGQAVTARQILDRGVERLELELADEPELEVEVLAALAEIYDNLGYRDEARELLTRALSVQETELGRRPTTRGRLLTQLADVEVASGRLTEAEVHLASAMSVLGNQGARGEPARFEARLLAATIGRQRDRLDRSAESLSQLLRDLERLRAPDEELVDRVLLELGSVYREQGEFPRARETIARAVTRIEARRGERDLLTTTAREALAAVLFDQGDWEAAGREMEAVLRARRAVLGVDHPSLIPSIYNLGAVEARRGRYRRAAEQFDDVLRRMRAAYGPHHPQVGPAALWAAQVALHLGAYDDAAEHAAAVVEMLEAAEVPRRELLIDALLLRGRAEQARGDLDAAARTRRRVIQLFPTTDETERPRSTFFAGLHLATMALEDDDLVEASRWLDRSRPLEPESYPTATIRRVVVEGTLALRRGDLETAEAVVASVGPDQVDALEVVDRLPFEHLEIALDQAAGRTTVAAARARATLATALATVGDDGQLTGRSSLMLGLSLLESDPESAREHLLRAVETLPEIHRRPPQGAPDAAEALRMATGISAASSVGGVAEGATSG